MEDLVTLPEIAERLNMDRSRARRWLLEQGFEFARVRTAETRGQATLALPLEEVERAVELRTSLGYLGEGVAPAAPVGYFYVVQPIPELEPSRVKLGYATSVDSRLATYRTISPCARVVGAWPCKPAWEAAAMDSVTREGCEHIGGEVYHCEDVTLLIERCEEFFSLMPALEAE